MIKSIFYNLPIEKSKQEIITQIKSDSILFTIDTSFSRDNIPFQANVNRRPKYLPKTYWNPKILLFEGKIIRDSSNTDRYSLVNLIFFYKSIFGTYKRAKKAYRKLIQITQNDFEEYTDYSYRLVNDPPDKKRILLRQFFIKSKEKPKCIIELNRSYKKGMWTVNILYRLD